MAVLLKLPHLVNKYGVPDMQVWRRRIEAGFDDKREMIVLLTVTLSGK